MGEVISVPHSTPQSDRVMCWWRFGRRVMMACPNGHAALLDHEIADDGRVSPSVDCPQDGCDFHTWVRLEGWSP